MIKNVTLSLGTLFILLIATEIFFRYTGKYKTDGEKHGGKYVSIYHSPFEKRWYHVYDPHVVNSQTLLEYSYSIYANNEGLLDKEFVTAKQSHTLRILVVGDSFVQGMGAPEDSSCPKQLEAILKAQFNGTPDVEVWNCGIGGSDPYYEYILLKNRLIQYKPDYVIEEINGTDIGDIMQRGGSERFNADSTVTYKPAPWFESIYAHSYIFRRILRDALNYSWTMLSPQQQITGSQYGVVLIDSCLLEFQKLCASKNIPLLVAFVPFKSEANGKSAYQMEPLINFCDSVHIQNVDLKFWLEKDSITGPKADALYWAVDMHFKSQGYAYFARCLSEPIINYIDSTKSMLPHL